MLCFESLSSGDLFLFIGGTQLDDHHLVLRMVVSVSMNCKALLNLHYLERSFKLARITCSFAPSPRLDHLFSLYDCSVPFSYFSELKIFKHGLAF